MEISQLLYWLMAYNGSVKLSLSFNNYMASTKLLELLTLNLNDQILRVQK